MAEPRSAGDTFHPPRAALAPRLQDDLAAANKALGAEAEQARSAVAAAGRKEQAVAAKASALAGELRATKAAAAAAQEQADAARKAAAEAAASAQAEAEKVRDLRLKFNNMVRTSKVRGGGGVAHQGARCAASVSSTRADANRCFGAAL